MPSIILKNTDLHLFFDVYDAAYDDELGTYLDTQTGSVHVIAHDTFHDLERKENLYAMPVDEAVKMLKALIKGETKGLNAHLLDDYILALHIEAAPERYLTVPRLGVARFSGLKLVSNNDLLRRFMATTPKMHTHLKQVIREDYIQHRNLRFQRFEGMLSQFTPHYDAWLTYKYAHWQALIRDWLAPHYDVTFV